MHRNNLSLCGIALVIWFIVAGLNTCPSTSVHSQVDRANLLHIKWMQSVEHAANCKQLYVLGWEKVLSYSKAQPGRRAVVLDIDETVVSNTQYNVEHEKYSDDTWLEWVKSKRSGILPGAKQFLDRLHGLQDIQIVFISDRWDRDGHSERSFTEEFMKDKQLMRDGDVLLMRTSREDTKDVRRREVEQGTGRCKNYGPLPIIAIFGDSIRDFEQIFGREAADRFRANIEKDGRWGRTFFIIPNPVYGAWERDYQ